jgi:hypothetical protein
VAGRDQLTEQTISFFKRLGMPRLSLIDPSFFHLRRVHEVRQAQVICGVLGRRGSAFGEIQRCSRCSRHQIFERNKSDRVRRQVDLGGSAHSRAVSPENINTKGTLRVDALQYRSTRWIQRVDVTEEEIISQRYGDAVE